MPKRRIATGKGEGKSEDEAQAVSADRGQAAEGEIEDTSLYSRIAARAYALFLARGCQHGDDLADWLQAEREVLSEERPAPDPEGP